MKVNLILEYYINPRPRLNEREQRSVQSTVVFYFILRTLYLLYICDDALSWTMQPSSFSLLLPRWQCTPKRRRDAKIQTKTPSTVRCKLLQSRTRPVIHEVICGQESQEKLGGMLSFSSHQLSFSFTSSLECRKTLSTPTSRLNCCHTPR